MVRRRQHISNVLLLPVHQCWSLLPHPRPHTSPLTASPQICLSCNVPVYSPAFAGYSLCLPTEG